MAKIDKKLRPLELAQHFDESPERIDNGRSKVSYQIIVLECSCLGSHLRRSIRLRAQRSDYMAVRPYLRFDRRPSRRPPTLRQLRSTPALSLKAGVANSAPFSPAAWRSYNDVFEESALVAGRKQ
jgi:hypothetical protein